MKKRKDGNYEATFTFDGKRYYVYGRSRQEVADKEREKRKELESKRYKRNDELTVSEFLDRWQESRVEITDSTLRQGALFIKISCESVIDDAGHTFGELMVVNVERWCILAVQRALKDAKNKDGKPRFGYRTINGAISLLKQAFDAAILDDVIVKNPCIGVRPVKQTGTAARDSIHRALSDAEVKAFFDAAEEMGVYYLPLFRFLISSGCRIGEAGALRLASIKGGWVQIAATVTRTVDGHYYIADTTKTAAGHRRIPYTQAMREAVEAQKANNRVLFGDTISLTDAIFRSPRGEILRESRVNVDILRVCNKAGIEKFTCHAFRATFATRCVESGMQPKVLQEIMGHSDIGITMNIYAHAQEDTKIKEMQKIGL